jgi:hypothetical protein
MVLSNAVILARTVNAQRVHIDLTWCPGDPPQYGRFNPIRGTWIEVYSEEVCRQQLRDWPTIIRRPGGQRLPMSEVTAAGRKWLASSS